MYILRTIVHSVTVGKDQYRVVFLLLRHGLYTRIGANTRTYIRTYTCTVCINTIMSAK